MLGHKNKKGETPAPEPIWYRIEVIESGPDRISELDYQRRMFHNNYSGEKSEKTVVTMDLRRHTELQGIKDLLLALQEKDSEVGRLKHLISQFQNAAEKIALEGKKK